MADLVCSVADEGTNESVRPDVLARLKKHAASGTKPLYRGDDSFVRGAVCTIVGPQIEARLLWFDAGQHQGSTASGAGRPKIIDELVFGRLRHAGVCKAVIREISSQFPQAGRGPKTASEGSKIKPSANATVAVTMEPE
jgi:hypothetical protein